MPSRGGCLNPTKGGGRERISYTPIYFLVSPKLLYENLLNFMTFNFCLLLTSSQNFRSVEDFSFWDMTILLWVLEISWISYRITVQNVAIPMFVLYQKKVSASWYTLLWYRILQCNALVFFTFQFMYFTMNSSISFNLGGNWKSLWA